MVEDMNRRGIQTIRRETEYKTAILYQALDAHPLLKAFGTNLPFARKLLWWQIADKHPEAWPIISWKRYASRWTVTAHIKNTSALQLPHPFERTYMSYWWTQFGIQGLADQWSKYPATVADNCWIVKPFGNKLFNLEFLTRSLWRMKSF